ncbi:hypothetical protein E4T38_04694 [Aureobasidium subglaciale]|nr:hypothetical protein E4T38_04694 [Aureobasidium subglaciale]KAI5223156.1 hypothetical protein E4T40_04708 [Aureobasidium subglaciale]KAI5226812.1 hypothetical protein E4T41_04651 [Aureobasidium subglaciale]KAI5262425.1 hypothetical protein E4T46_04537 [Aureobasidium subglaciale]
MSGTQVTKRKRSYKSRTRTGCITCSYPPDEYPTFLIRSWSVRRVKCDEEHPSCRKCVSTGRKCDGYVVSRAASPSCYRDLSLNLFKPGEEAGAIEFFLRVSIDQLSGNSQPEFWRRHIIQLAHQDTGTRHGLLALAHLHRDFTNHKTQSTRNQSALRHYNIAIQHHVTSMVEGPQDAMQSGSFISTAIIFICVELMQGHIASAVSLLQRAVTLIPATATRLISLHEDLVGRLQIQAKRLVSKDLWGPHDSQHKKICHNPGSKRKPDWKNPYQNLSKDGAALCEEPSLWEKIQWACSITEVADGIEHATLSARERAAADVVRIRKLLVTTFMLADEVQSAQEEERAVLSDSLLPIYRAIIALAERIMGLSPLEQNNTLPHTPCFTLDMGIIGPLYEVAWRCRDPEIRRRIIDLLRRSNRQEGLLRSSIYARIVETIVDIEEGGLSPVLKSGDIPLCARMAKPSLSFDLTTSKLFISYRLLLASDLDTLYCREITGID